MCFACCVAYTHITVEEIKVTLWRGVHKTEMTRHGYEGGFIHVYDDCH